MNLKELVPTGKKLGNEEHLTTPPGGHADKLETDMISLDSHREVETQTSEEWITKMYIFDVIEPIFN